MTLEQQSLSPDPQSERYKVQFLIQQTPLGIIEWNRQFQAVGWNPAAERIFGYSADEIYLQHASILVPEAYRDYVDSVMTALLQNTGGTYSLNDNITKDGRIITCEWINTPLIDPQGIALGIYSMVQDITERVNSERQLKESQTQILQKTAALEATLEELKLAQLHLIHGEKMSALGNLIAGIAHEINNPLGFLKGNIQPALDHIGDLFELIDLFHEKHPDLDSTIQELIEDIDLDYIRDDLPKLMNSMHQGIDRIRDISISLRTFSRADSDVPVRFNLHDGLDSTILLLKHRLKGNDHRPDIQVIKQYAELPMVKCFAGQLNQVFMNILANAIDELDEASQLSTIEALKQTPQRITVTSELSPDRQWAIVRFQDNGRGMAAPLQSKIFEHLFTTKPVGKGTGLGLTLSRQIIEERHGGRLTVESIEGEGTTFSVALPLTD